MKRLLLCCFALLFSFPVAAATASSSPDLRVYFGNTSFYGLDWCKESWTGSDEPFVSIRRDINSQIARGSKRDVLLSSYERAAQRAPQSPSAQFAYAYAAWRATDTVTDGRRIDPMLEPALKAMGNVPSPRSYEFTRLRWILEHTSGQYSGFMPVIGLGRRLMQRNPKDRIVRFYLMEELLMSRIRTDITVLLPRYAQEVEAEPSKRATTYSLLGNVYRNVSFLTHSPAYADKAILNYRRYLRMTPPSYFPQYRGMVEDYIRRVEKLKVQFTQEKQR